MTERASPLDAFAFSWAAIDRHGCADIDRWIDEAIEGGPGSDAAIARLCEIATDGRLAAETVLASPPPREETVRGLCEAWRDACYGGPDRRPWIVRKMRPRPSLAAIRARMKVDLARAQLDMAAPYLAYLERLIGSGADPGHDVGMFEHHHQKKPRAA